MKVIATFVFFIVSTVCVNAIMITHSHCPNHSKNNSENMHTHDTTDPDHDAKHRTGHPHTWEFDEFCPKGTERDTSKKSRPFGGDPNNDKPKPRDSTKEEDVETPKETNTALQTSGDSQITAPVVSTTPESPHRPIRLPAHCGTLTGYTIETNDKDQIRITGEPITSKLYLWFDDQETTIYAVLSGYVSYGRFNQFSYNAWVDMDTLTILDYRQPFAKCRCQNLSIADAKKMVLMVLAGGWLCPVAEYPEQAPSAPSLTKPKLAVMWANLKR